MSARIVKCPLPAREDAERIAQTLVEEHLAACAQVVGAPILSFYRWEGKMERSEEWLLLLKTDAINWGQTGPSRGTTPTFAGWATS